MTWSFILTWTARMALDNDNQIIVYTTSEELC